MLGQDTFIIYELWVLKMFHLEKKSISTPNVLHLKSLKNEREISGTGKLKIRMNLLKPKNF